MTRQTLQEVKNTVEELAAKISAPKIFLPTYGRSEDFAQPHIELNNQAFHYVIVERGQELLRKSTTDFDCLLYWIFENITSEMSSEYEVRNRIQSRDGRRMMFAKQQELLGELSRSWRQKKSKEHEKILQASPYDDLTLLRATYCMELRTSGRPEDEITKLAFARYPDSRE